MFGFGSNRNRGRNRGRNSTFSNSNLRNAAIAGAGVLAYRWWKGRQATRGTGSAGSSFGGSSADMPSQ
jgi:hypothetical protein